MNNEKGAASFVGVLLVLLVLALATYILLETQGLLIKGEGEEEQSPIDQALTVSVFTELRQVKQGLELYRTTNPDLSYPLTSQINSVDQLRSMLPASFPLPDSVSFTFISYEGSREGWTLRVRSRDTIGTMYEVGSAFATRKYEP